MFFYKLIIRSYQRCFEIEGECLNKNGLFPLNVKQGKLKLHRRGPTWQNRSFTNKKTIYVFFKCHWFRSDKIASGLLITPTISCEKCIDGLTGTLLFFRVARWYICAPTIQIWVYFFINIWIYIIGGGLWVEIIFRPFDKFCGYLAYFVLTYCTSSQEKIWQPWFYCM
jgi:hypothetical protein